MIQEPTASLFINREQSWLAFNERVLAEARDRSTPLLERLKFAAIAASNLDEFFMVRVAALRHANETGETAVDMAGLSPSEQFTAVATRSHALVDDLYGLLKSDLLPALAREQIQLLSWKDLEPFQLGLSAYFRDAILPILTPLAIDESRPFPLLASLCLNLALILDAPAPDEPKRLAIVQVPGSLTRLIPVPGGNGLSHRPPRRARPGAPVAALSRPDDCSSLR